MKFVGKHKKFWYDIIVGRINPETVFKQNYMPDQRITKLLAEEGISAVKGSVRHKFSVQHVGGKLVMTRFNNGSYSTGILKRTSPDGTPFVPLSEKTLNARKDEGNRRGPAFILRETSAHIYKGLKILSQTITRKGSVTTMGWSGDDAKRANQHDKGFIQNYKYTNKKGKTSNYPVEIPARPFIGYSKEFLKNMQQFWNKITKV